MWSENTNVKYCKIISNRDGRTANASATAGQKPLIIG